mgnify:CR=1 FL=1
MVNTNFIILEDEDQLPNDWEEAGATIVRSTNTIGDLSQAYGKILSLSDTGHLSTIIDIPQDTYLTTNSLGEYVTKDVFQMIPSAGIDSPGLVSINDDLFVDENLELDSISEVYSKRGVLNLVNSFIAEPYPGKSVILEEAQTEGIARNAITLDEAKSYTDTINIDTVDYIEEHIQQVKENILNTVLNSETLELAKEYADSLFESLNESQTIIEDNLKFLFSSLIVAPTEQTETNIDYIVLNNNYLWVDSTGDLRINASIPQDMDLDGVVVGTQTA